MPEYRHDPLTGRIVIIAEERADRPHQFDITDSGSAANAVICPFCEGNESLTPNETAAFRSADSKPNSTGWQVRAVPNKYPAVVPADFQPPFWEEGFVQKDGIGQHEVIIDTVRHVLSIAELTPLEVTKMLAMYQRRLRSLRTDSRWAYVQIFKNVGAAAGASLPHSHSQLVAMPFLPPSLQQVLQGAYKYYEQHQRCFWCDSIQKERYQKERIVEESEHFIVLCPFVSRFAGEIEIYPKNHLSRFEEMDELCLDELATIFRQTILRLEKAVFWMKDRLAYNVILNTEPFQGKSAGQFHWHFSILPSLARAAGFEWGTGLHINPISPEQAAERLREN